MSIADLILALEHQGQLRRFLPPRTRLPAVRRLYLAVPAMKDFDDPHSAANYFSGRSFVEGALTRWVLGGRVWAVERRKKREGGFLKRLEPPPNDVWEVKVTEPRPQVRLFGRFAEADTLILTKFHLRDSLKEKGSSQWGAAMTECDNLWSALFPRIPIYSKSTISDYVTRNCDDYPI